MTTPTHNARPGDGLIEALHVADPAPEHANKLMLFGRFVGSWALEWTGKGPDGRPASMNGELHFGWVLGGRAIQDIWIAPGRGNPGEGQPPLAFHGSTIRFYDPPSTRGAPPGSSRTHFGGAARSPRDSGATWDLDEEMLATRTGPA